MLHDNKYVARTCLLSKSYSRSLNIEPVYDNSVKFMEIDLQVLIILLYVLREEEENIGVQESPMHLTSIF